MNKLANELSPYLLQHANNPVDWYPWGDEAFAEAEKQDKPIFLSIGYSTCHWCHVMEHESFEDVDVANILNKNFISIKVDREERPDIDNIYMNICQMTTGSGGWPLTVFMTPDCKPFFTGTYFPKNRMHGRIGLVDLLKNVTNMWDNNREKLLESSIAIINALKEQNFTHNKNNEVISSTFEYLQNNYDKKHGGFGSEPKFPLPSNIQFLLKYYTVTNDKNALAMAENTLQYMAKGGIFDHIGYGFSRYSTDRIWLVPHFEKMLYDNAQLISAYLDCYVITKNSFYSSIASRCISYVLNNLRSLEGGFYSAEDADSNGVEGLFYTFDRKEIVDILGENDAKIFLKTYDISEKGNFEGKNIPNQLSNNEFVFDDFNQKLYDYRKARHTLHRDDKVLTVWNCLMISALTKAAIALNDNEYLNIAITTYNFITENLTNRENIYTSWRKGKHNNNGVLDDYAFYIKACIDLYQSTLDKQYMEKALFFIDVVQREFYDKNGGYYFTKEDSKMLISRLKEFYDGVIPSGNSVMLQNLELASAFYGDNTDSNTITKLAHIQFEYLSSKALYGGQSYFALVKLQKENFSKAICVYSDLDKVDKNKLSAFDLSKIIEPSDEYPLINDSNTYYVCNSNSCSPPTNYV